MKAQSGAPRNVARPGPVGSEIMPRELPRPATLERLRQEAKDFLRELEKGVPTAIRRARLAVTIPVGTRPRLSDAQHVIAREYGFAGWPKLKDHLEALARDPGLAVAVVETTPAPAAAEPAAEPAGAPPDPRVALVDAVRAGHVARARDLLGRHPHLQELLDGPMPELPFGSVLIMAAARAGNGAMVDLLIEAGADINKRSHWWAGGFGVLDRCDPGFAPFLIERGAQVDVHAAARLGMLDRLRELVARSPTVTLTRGGDGQTPLHNAANVEIARFLLEHGADIDARDIDHESTPAQYMVRDRQEVARFLVARGCATDLLMAAALGDVDLARRHLDADPACIRMTVNERWFPKQDTRAGGTIYIWTIGANRSPHAVARESGHIDVFSLLMERSPIELQLALACEFGDRTLVDSLLTGLPDLAQTLDEQDLRRLPDAAQDNNEEGVRLMLIAGWPVGARGQHGGTALHWAAFHGNATMAREILRHAPELETLDHDYQQPALGWALYGSLHGWHADAGDYAEAVEALLDAGARPPERLAEVEASAAVRAVLERRAAGGR
jgi:ankyrin repeat protein